MYVSGDQRLVAMKKVAKIMVNKCHQSGANFGPAIDCGSPNVNDWSTSSGERPVSPKMIHLRMS